MSAPYVLQESRHKSLGTNSVPHKNMLAVAATAVNGRLWRFYHLAVQPQQSEMGHCRRKWRCPALSQEEALCQEWCR